METPLEIVERAYHAWDEHDVVEALCALDPDVRLHREDGLPYAGDFVGRGAVAGVVEDILSDWSWLEMTPLRYASDGDLVSVVGRYTGEGKVTGFRFSDQFVHLWRVENGRGTWLATYRTTAEALHALDDEPDVDQDAQRLPRPRRLGRIRRGGVAEYCTGAG